MKLGFKRGQKGFTLIEIIIVLAVMAVMAAAIVPNVSGFLGRGKERSWNADRDMLQVAVDSYRTDIGNRASTGNPWPTLGRLIGLPIDSSSNGDYAAVGDKDTKYEPTGATDNTSTANEDLNSFIDIGLLVADKYLKAGGVKSADKRFNTSDNNTPNGSYGWYIDTNGLVNAIYWVDADNGHAGATTEAKDVDAAEVEGKSGYVTNIYP